MPEVSLLELLREGLVDELRGDGAVRVAALYQDADRIEPGDLFVAIPGKHTPAEAGVPTALARGAAAVLGARVFQSQVPSLLCRAPRVAYAKVARRIYGDPGAELSVVGVTGTNGKTTTLYLLEAILSHAGYAPALIGTIGARGPGGTRATEHTTPMSDELMRLCRWAVDTGASHLLLEASSHGLAMHRVDGLRFEVAAFTNFSPDHLDYHGDLASYEAAKRRLFEELEPARCVINVQDPVGARIAAGLDAPCLRCARSAAAGAEIEVVAAELGRAGIRARLRTSRGELELRSPLMGEHNLENLLVAVGCALSLGVPLPVIGEALRTATGPPGRLERIEHDPEDVAIFVDYAHTPDALARTLCTLRSLTAGKLWLVFGCGGERDRSKRPLMGTVAARHADIVILTDDNPRNEPSEAILAQIEAGVRGVGVERAEPSETLRRGYQVEPDRRRAIGLALRYAAREDTLLIAGKGHEGVQIVQQRREPFDDREVARVLVTRVR